MNAGGAFVRIVGCPCFGTYYVGACICDDNEKALRAYTSPNFHPPAMTAEQRAWCLDEIASVEGHSRDECGVNPTDAMLASAVLHAWQDYCQDKGLR